MDIKEDYIKLGLSNWDVDIFGIAETNLDWRLLKEEDKLWARTREWWEHLYISFSYNCTFPALQEKQFGGTATFTVNDITHRVVDKGRDATQLGRWSWSKLRGKNGHTLVIITAYRPQPSISRRYGCIHSAHKIFQFNR
jgi:hypothetical protein